MLKKYSIKKIGYHPDRMKILKVGTAYLRKYLDAGYTKREALKQSNLDAAHHIQSHIGSHKKGIKALPAAKKIIKQHEPEIKKSIPQMEHRKKTARKKTAKRKKVHTIPGKVKSYRRKATVKAHTRFVAGIGNLNSASQEFDSMVKLIKDQESNKAKLIAELKRNPKGKNAWACRADIKTLNKFLAHNKRSLIQQKKLIRKLL